MRPLSPEQAELYTTIRQTLSGIFQTVQLIKKPGSMSAALDAVIDESASLVTQACAPHQRSAVREDLQRRLDEALYLAAEVENACAADPDQVLETAERDFDEDDDEEDDVIGNA
jgi:hypothetical protein